MFLAFLEVVSQVIALVLVFIAFLERTLRGRNFHLASHESKSPHLISKNMNYIREQMARQEGRNVGISAGEIFGWEDSHAK